MVGTITQRFGIVPKAHPRLVGGLTIAMLLLTQAGAVAAGAGGTVG